MRGESVHDARLVEARAVGLLGSVVVAAAASSAGAKPFQAALFDVPVLNAVPPFSMALAYFGMTLLVAAWWRLGVIVRGSTVAPRHLVVTLAWWAAPLAVSVPLYSRDVYSYLAQGMMVVRGIDPYQFGPAALGGPLTDQVSAVWQHTPAPYGPGFLVAAGGVMAVIGEHVIAGLVGMRLLALASLAVMAWAVPVIARRHHVDASRALWLGVLNPLVLAHVVSGAHNEALMVALILLAVVLTQHGRPHLAVVVVALAFLVKAPAIVALAFVVAAMWGPRRLRPWPLTALVARVAGVAVTTVVAVSLVSRTGWGWIPALGNTIEIRNGLSMSTNLGALADSLLSGIGLAPGFDLIEVTRVLGVLAAAGLAGYLLLRHRDRPFYGLAVTLVALVVLGPVVNPWYLLWGSVLLAATTAHRRVVQAMAVVSVGLAFYPMPQGGGPTSEAIVGLLGIAAGVVLLPLSAPLAAPLGTLSEAVAGVVADSRSRLAATGTGGHRDATT